MTGLDARTLAPLSDLDHLRQSVGVILSTPIGSRVMRREFGSRLFELVDSPMNRSTVLAIYAATAEALARWEPRIAVERVSAQAPGPGRIVIELEGRYLPDGREIRLTGIEVL